MSVSKECTRLAALTEAQKMTFAEFLRHIPSHSLAILTLLLGMPFLIPVPLPGLSIPFGILIVLVSAQMAFGIQPKLPGKLARRQVPQALMIRVFNTIQKVFEKIEPWVGPRWSWVYNSGLRFFSCVVIALWGAFLALPLPPGTNAPPAFMIVWLSIGILEEDGLALILGLVASVITAIIISMVMAWGLEAIGF